ncbi:MAG: 4Fe-4S binding protein [Bacillus subtilis]|nr:4Fe-4S binding protein [Bacillus subtilis]
MSVEITALISFLLFPVTLNFFSPYVSIDGAMAGIISGSLLLFGLFFLFGVFFGRAWCSYGCPWAAPSEYLMKVNNKPVNRKRLAVIRYIIFFIWFSVLVLGFVLAGGIKGVDPLHLTDSFGFRRRTHQVHDLLYGIVVIVFMHCVDWQTWRMPFDLLDVAVHGRRNDSWREIGNSKIQSPIETGELHFVQEMHECLSDVD